MNRIKTTIVKQPFGNLLDHKRSPSTSVNIPPITVTETNYMKLVDEVNETTTYIGYAVPGSAYTDSVWRIKRITFSGNDVTEHYADGTDAFTKKWSDRDSYAYS